MAAAGSKEAKQLEQIKNIFDRAYKEMGKASEADSNLAAEGDSDTDIRYALREYNDNERLRIFKSDKNVIPVNESELDALIDGALNKGERETFINFGMIPKSVTQRIKNEVSEISQENREALFRRNEFSNRVRQSEVYHLKKVGMTDAEAKEYVKKIPHTVSEFDTVRYTEEMHDGQLIKGLLFYKMFPDGTMRSYLLVSNRKGTLTTKTTYMEKADFVQNKKKSSLLPDVQTPSLTSETKSSSTSNKTIPTKEDVVNKKQSKEYTKNGNNVSKTKYSLSDTQGRSLSKSQQEYFKDSKVRDENGNLLTVYHGSKNKFNEFTSDINWFSSSKEYSNNYGKEANLFNKVTKIEPKKSKVTFETYLDIKNPNMAKDEPIPAEA